MTRDAFYSDARRARSPELDFGVLWRDGRCRCWRVSYIDATGEVYRAAGDEYELLGTLPLERCPECAGAGCTRCGRTGNSRDPVERLLDGWADVCGLPLSLYWVTNRCATVRL